MSEAHDFRDILAEHVKELRARHEPQEALHTEVERLAALGHLELELELEKSAASLKMKPGELKKLVSAARRDQKTKKSSRQPDPAPSEEPPPPPPAGTVAWPVDFSMRDTGLWYLGAEGQSPLWICGPFEVVGKARTAAGENWTRVIRWMDPDGRAHEMPIDDRLLHATNTDIESDLASRGLTILPDPKARALLRQALMRVQVSAQITLTNKVGWLTTVGGARAYACADGSTISPSGEAVMLHPAPKISRQFYATQGTLDEWKRDVASLAVGNPFVMFCVSAAFCGPLLRPLHESSGGFHAEGISKTGKTLAVRLGASVWYRADTVGGMCSWDATGTGFETHAQLYNDGVYVLDEMARAKAPQIVDTIYMLSNEVGKSRGSKNITAAERGTWKTFILSTGEKDVASFVTEAKQSLPAGADIRLPSIPTTPENTWPELHRHADLHALGKTIYPLVTAQQYGTAGRAFVARLAGLTDDDLQDLQGHLSDVREWIAEELPTNASAQVKEVVQRFGLVAFAGELAIRWGVLPYEEGSAKIAARAMMRRWLEARGSVASSDEDHTLQKLRAFLLSEGPARFIPVMKTKTGNVILSNLDTKISGQVWGWRYEDENAPERGSDYLISTSVWPEVCAKLGIAHKAALNVLDAKGHVLRGEGRNIGRKQRLPGHGAPLRVVHIKAGFLDGEA